MTLRAGVLIGTCAFLVSAPLAAQSTSSPVGLTGVQADLARADQLLGTVPVPTSMLRRYSETGARPRSLLTVLPVELSMMDNSGYADDRDNGLAWSGRGVSGLVRAGVAARWRWFSAALMPEAAYWQNSDFETRLSPYFPGRDTMAHGIYPLDLPQRLGSDAGSATSLGQSYVRADVGPVGAGFSNENLWSSPAARYPIIVGNSAPGFPHVFFGTNRPVDLWITRVDARVIVGWTEESDYFDVIEENDFSNIMIWSLAFRPRGMDWLEVGLQRSLHYPVEGRFDFQQDQLFGFLHASEVNRVGDELAAAYFRAVLPRNRIELYGEWARADRFASWLEDFVPEIDHSQGYMLGLQKLVLLPDERHLRIHGEVIDLQEQAETRRGAGRPLTVFYGNTQQGRGHTHRGQILGASIGPGADAQYLAVDLIDRDDRLLGVFGERVRRNDAQPQKFGIVYDMRDSFPFRHDVELIGGVRALAWFGDVSLAGSASYARRYYRQFVSPVDSNVQFSLDLGWWPGRNTGD